MKTRGAQREAQLVNHVRELREAQLMSRAELARKAGVSALTVGRIEAGYDCRMATKRKIIQALGLTLAEREKVFSAPQEAERVRAAKGPGEPALPRRGR